MAAYTVANIDRAGVRYDNALVAVAAADTFINDGRTLLLVDNQNAATCEVTFDLATDPNSSEPTQSTSAVNQSVLTTEQQIFGPFPVDKFGAIVTVNYSLIPTVTAAAFRLPAN